MKTIQHDLKIAGSVFDLDISIQKNKYEELSNKYQNPQNYYYNMEEEIAEHVGVALKNRLIAPQTYGEPVSLDVVNVAFPNTKELVKLNVEVWEEGEGSDFFILVGDINHSTNTIDYNW